jgi:hypothetical protein
MDWIFDSRFCRLKTKKDGNVAERKVMDCEICEKSIHTGEDIR